MKLRLFILGVIMLVVPAFADDATTQKLTERKTCAEISAEMATLSAIENPDEETAAQLKQLQTQNRANCTPRATGRRTVARNMPTGVTQPKPADATTATSDALSEYLANKKSNCDKLNSEIAKIAASETKDKADELASMRGVYDMDCAERHEMTEKPEPVPVEKELSVEEWAAQYDANLAAGLCGDGAKPNRYGCCTDETFRDMGDGRYACCPKTGGDCFPPIN